MYYSLLAIVYCFLSNLILGWF